jgi:hypothetical protein
LLRTGGTTEGNVEAVAWFGFRISGCREHGQRCSVGVISQSRALNLNGRAIDRRQVAQLCIEDKEI